MNKDWIKQNWWLITAGATIYIYSVAFLSTLLFYDAFEISISSYFNISDYLRFLFRDVEIFAFPFFIMCLVFASLLLRKSEREFADQEKRIYKPSFFLRLVPLLIILASFAFPVFMASHQSGLIMSGVYDKADIKLKDKELFSVAIIGGVNDFIFIYGPPPNKAKAININEVVEIHFKGPSEPLHELNRKRSESFRKSGDL
ncbi:MAG: hypothetical protein PVG66_01125 [Chromatiales bacterium]|jgi:hypothetical protein